MDDTITQYGFKEGLYAVEMLAQPPGATITGPDRRAPPHPLDGQKYKAAFWACTTAAREARPKVRRRARVMLRGGTTRRAGVGVGWEVGEVTHRKGRGGCGEKKMEDTRRIRSARCVR